MIRFAVVDGALIAVIFQWSRGFPRFVHLANMYGWIRNTRRTFSALSRVEFAEVLGLWPQSGGDA